MHKYVLLSIVLFAILVIVAFGHSKQVVKDMLDSLKPDKNGYSNTKLIGWIWTIIGGYIAIHDSTPENLKDVLFMCLVFIAVCLGLVKVGDLIALRTGQKVTETEKQTGPTIEKSKIQEPISMPEPPPKQPEQQ